MVVEQDSWIKKSAKDAMHWLFQSHNNIQEWFACTIMVNTAFNKQCSRIGKGQSLFSR